VCVGKIKKDKARKGDEKYSIHIKSRYLNAIEFGARQPKKGVSAKIWGVRKVYRGAFIGSGRNSGKQLVFKSLRLIQEELKLFMALHYQESLNDKTWLNYLIRKSKHGSQFDLNGHWIFI
jgi:hypothetical protein